MTITVAQPRATNTSSTTSVTATLGSTPTNGNLLRAVVGAVNVTDETTITISGWTPAAGIGAATGANLAIREFYKIASGDAAAVTANATGATAMQIEVTEVNSSTGWQASPVDKSGTRSLGSGTTSMAVPSSALATTAQADEYAVAAVALGGVSGGSEAVSPGSWTLRTTIARLITADQILTATAALQATFSWATGRAVRGVIVTYMPVVPVAYTRTVTDAMGTTDSLTRAAAYARSQTDAMGTSDTVARAAAYARAQTDAMGFSDTRAVVVGFARSTSDALGLTDSLARAASYARSLTDAIGLADAVSSGIGFGRSVTDQLGLTDALAREQQAQRTVTDPMGLTDEISYTRVLSMAITDAFRLTDQLTHTLVRFLKRRLSGRESDRSLSSRQPPRTLSGREPDRTLSGREPVT